VKDRSLRQPENIEYPMEEMKFDKEIDRNSLQSLKAYEAIDCTQLGMLIARSL